MSSKDNEEYTDEELKKAIEKTDKELRKEKKEFYKRKLGKSENEIKALQQAIIIKEENLKMLHKEKYRRQK